MRDVAAHEPAAAKLSLSPSEPILHSLSVSMDAFEATKPDRFHQSLSNSWASFLSAHHFGREVAALRKALDEHTRQTRLAIASLEKTAADKHAPLAAAIAESKSTIEQHAAELREISTLRADLSAHQQRASQGREDASRRNAELSQKLAAQRESLENAQSLTSREITAVQEQYRLALETIDRLRGELSEARADKITSEEKLAALEERINAMSQSSPSVSENAARFLEEMLSRRDELIELLDTPPQRPAIPAVNPTPPSAPTSMSSASQALIAPSGIIPWDHPHIPPPSPTQHQPTQPARPRPPTPPKRNAKEPPYPPQPPPPANLPPSTDQDIRALYLLFRDRYRTSPPRSDTAFIWEFLGRVEPPAMSRHIQESLAVILPEHVARCRETRRRDPRRHVTISKGLTWRRFREALVRIPGPE